MDRHHIIADPDSKDHPDADLDADPDFDFLFDADPDPTFHPDADPDPDPSFKKQAQSLKTCYKRLIFHKFWLDICKLMQMRIQVTNMMRILADPDPQHCFYGTVGLMKIPLYHLTT